MTLKNTGDRLELAFDSAEAKGRIILERCAYGLAVIFPDLVELENEQAALIDLFYASEGEQKIYPDAVAAIHVWGKEYPTDDSLVTVIYFRDKKTELEVR